MTNLRIEPTLQFTSLVNKVQFDKQCVEGWCNGNFQEKRVETYEITVLDTESEVIPIECLLRFKSFFFVCVQTFIENIFPAVHGCNCSK